MKIQYTLLSFVLFFLSTNLLSAQDADVVIPIQDGKVVFTDTIPIEGVSGDVLYSKIEEWVGSYLSLKKGSILKNDKENQEIEFRVQDYMEMEKKPLSIFAIYMKYAVQVDYKNGFCTIKIGDIKYIEPEQIEKETPYVMNAENILLENEYKVLFVSDASGKVKYHTKKNIDELFRSLRMSLQN